MYCTHKNPHSENGRLFAFNWAESPSDFFGKVTSRKNCGAIMQSTDDHGARTRDLCRDRSAFDRNPLKTWALMANKSTVSH